MAEPDQPVIIHTLDDALAALGIGAAILQTAPGAASYTGSLYFLKLFDQARNNFPDAIFILDCADQRAEAIAAMQMGHRHVRVSVSDAVFAKLADIAEQLDAILLSS